LPAAVQRFAVREFSEKPDMKFNEFKHRLSRQIFGAEAAPEAINDLVELQRIWTFESDWYWPSPLFDPEFFRQRASRLKWSKEKRDVYAQNLARLKEIEKRYANSTNAAERDMARLAGSVVTRWGAARPGF
jgi:hypothetical protein